MRHPLVRFLAVGALLAGLHWSTAERGGLPHGAAVASLPPPVVITTERIERLFARQEQWTGAPLADADRRGIVEAEVTDALLLRAAIDLGLDRADPRIGWRLLEKMRYLGEADENDPAGTVRRAIELGLHEDDTVIQRLLTEKMRSAARFAGEREPGEAELAAFFEENRQRWRRPGHTTFWQVFVPSGPGGNDAAVGEARGLLAALRAIAAGPDEGSRRGAPFPSGRYVRAADAEAVAATFGATFQDALSTLPARSWQGPIHSAFGQHLVWIVDRAVAGLAGLDDVRGQVVQAWKAEQRDLRAQAFVETLRRSYEVRVEWPGQSDSSRAAVDGGPDA